jgi:hypothetical protein
MTIAQCKDGRTALLSKGTIEIQMLVGAISTANITISYRDFYIGGRRRYFIALSFGKFQEFIKASIAVTYHCRRATGADFGGRESCILGDASKGGYHYIRLMFGL